MENFKADCVADTSTLIALARGEAIDCLGELFRKVYIPKEGKIECQDRKTTAAIQKSFVKSVLGIMKANGEGISKAVYLKTLEEAEEL